MDLAQVNGCGNLTAGTADVTDVDAHIFHKGECFDLVGSFNGALGRCFKVEVGGKLQTDGHFALVGVGQERKSHLGNDDEIDKSTSGNDDNDGLSSARPIRTLERVNGLDLQPGDVVYIPHDNISEYNVFVRKLLPTAQFLSTFTFPALNFVN